MALVTGGARRIGEAIVRRLARAGFAVAVGFRDSRAEAVELAAEVGGVAVSVDLSSPSSLRRAASSINRRFGRLELLVHNASVFEKVPDGAADRVVASAWERATDAHLRGPLLLTRALLPLLRNAADSFGRRAPSLPSPLVLFVGDAHAGEVWPSYLPYCATKLLLEASIPAIRSALRSDGIRTTLVRPGLVLPPPGFPAESWVRLRSSKEAKGPSTPQAVAEAVVKVFRRRRG